MLEDILKALQEQKETLGGRFDVIVNQLTDMDTRLKDAEALLTPRKVSLPGVNEGKEGFSFMKAVYAIRTGDWSNAGFEKEVFDNTSKRTLYAGSAGAGGYIVPAEYIAELIELIRANLVVAGLGATVLDNLQGSPIEFPKQLSGATAYWVDENETITPSDLTFGQLSLTPKAVAAMVKLSNRLIKLSNPSAEALVRNDIALVMALAIDLACLRGTGTDAQPLGIVNTPGINTVEIGTEGGIFNFDHAQKMEGTLEDDNALRGNLAYVMNPKVKRILKSLKVQQYSTQTSDMEYLLGMPMSDAKLAEAIGYKFATTTQIPATGTKNSGINLSEVIFGNWTELLIGRWGGMELMASTEAGDAFSKNQTWVRVIQEVDTAVRHAESFCLCSDACTTTA
jgi:HK97 family phage major capsid protein